MGEIGDQRIVVRAGEQTVSDGVLEGPVRLGGNTAAQFPGVALVSEADGVCRRRVVRDVRRLRGDGPQFSFVEVGAERGDQGLPLVEAHVMPFRQSQGAQGCTLTRRERVGRPPAGAVIRREHDGPRPRPEFVHLGVDFDDELDTDSPGLDAELCHDPADGDIPRLVRVPRCPSPLSVRQDYDVAEVLLLRYEIEIEE